MTSKWLVVIALTLAACASDDGGAGSGDDSLPKRGELSSDPTIVSAVANCSCGGEICSGGETNTHIRVRVAATDPAGLPNLGNCSGTVNGASDQDSYGGGSAGSDCYLYFQTACTPSQAFTIGLTVSNDMGGVTTASVKLTVSPD
ncbi:MAG TPA: hypothetical protein VIV11_31985 [Kofleriaceae bacterium]